MSAPKSCYVAALVLFLIAAILAFTGNSVSQIHILGLAFAGLAFTALAPVVA